MIKKYFTLPLKTDRLITNKEYAKCDLKQSIGHHIHLINTTYFGECNFDESFGCSIWEIDFDNLSSSNKIKDNMTQSLVESLGKHEKRLSRVSVTANIKQEELSSSFKSTIVKKKVTLQIKAIVKKTNEDFFYEEYFFIGPLSY